MDHIEPIICSLCNEPAKESRFIRYSCTHTFCFLCFPYLYFHNLKTHGLSGRFFENYESDNNCPICVKGKTKFPYEQIWEKSLFLQFLGDNKQNETENFQKTCEGCGDNASQVFCLDCKKAFCEECLALVHQIKKFRTHKFTILSQKQQIDSQLSKNTTATQYECNCANKNIATDFCSKCRISICPTCLKQNHEGHTIFKLDDYFMFPKIQTQINILLENYSLFKDCVSKDVEESKNRFITQINISIEEIILLLRNVKENAERITIFDTEFLKSQMELLGSSLSFLQREVSSVLSGQKQHPNKHFQLLKLFEDVNVLRMQSSQIPKINCGHDKYGKISGAFEKIRNMLEDLQPELETKKHFIFDFPVLLKLQFNRPIPIDLITTKKFEKVIEEKSFDFNWNKSNLCCNFSIYYENDEKVITNGENDVIANGESCLAWAGCSLDDETFPLIVFNLSNMKRQVVLQQDNPKTISFVATFPQNEDEERIAGFPKKWLYCGDKKGILRIYEIPSSKENPDFVLRSEIKTADDLDEKQEILSAVIFVDKYQELEQNNLYNCYLIISFNEDSENSPILLYKNSGKYKLSSNKEDQWTLFRKVKNPTGTLCFTITFKYDEMIQKTCFYFGFSDSFVSIYDLKNDSWEKTEFTTTAKVNSMNLFLKNESSCGYLIYTQENNEVIIGNIRTRKIEKKVALEDVSYINDCCLWSNKCDPEGATYLIMATRDKNTIQILDFDSLEVLLVKVLDNVPVNLLRTFINKRILETVIIKECLTFFLESGDSSRIVLFDQGI